MNRFLLLIACLLITCQRWNGIDGMVRCFKCKGHTCQWMSNWQNCTGDACFLRNPTKYKINGDKHSKFPIKSTANFKLATSTKPKTTTHKLVTTTKPKTTTHKLVTTTKPKTTSSPHFGIVHSAAFQIPTKTTSFPYFKKPSTTLHVTPKTATTTPKFVPMKPTTKSKQPRSHGDTRRQRSTKDGETERGCMREEEIPKLGCHKNLCVCLRDFCNDQIAVTHDRLLVSFSPVVVALYHVAMSRL